MKLHADLPPAISCNAVSKRVVKTMNAEQKELYYKPERYKITIPKRNLQMLLGLNELLTRWLREPKGSSPSLGTD